jgi:hypothetical protein
MVTSEKVIVAPSVGATMMLGLASVTAPDETAIAPVPRSQEL